MQDKDKELRESDKQDGKQFATFLNDARREGIFNNLIGVALSSYMNGVSDACRSFKAAQTA